MNKTTSKNVHFIAESASGKTQPQVIIGSNGQPIRILQNGQLIYSNTTMQKLQEPQSSVSTGIDSTGPRIISDEIIQPVHHSTVHQQVFHPQNSPRMMAPQQIIPQGQIESVQVQQNRSSGQTQIITVQQHVPTSQPFAMNQSIRQPHPQSIIQQQTVNRTQPEHHQRIILPSSNQTDSNQSMELSIGGQTVTHLPNGMVQVQQNCDIAHMKQQQQIQLQQQIQQQNILFRQQQELQQNPLLKDQYQTCNSTQDTVRQQHQVSTRAVAASSQESPVSSSTTYRSKIVEKRTSSKGPAQVGAISTSNQSPPAVSTCASPADSPESLQARTITSVAAFCPPKIHAGGIVRSQTTGKNTITSVLAGKTMTSTTTTNHAFGKQAGSVGDKDSSSAVPERQLVHVSSSQMVQLPNQTMQQVKITSAGPNQSRTVASMIQNCVPVSTALSNLQLQPICRGEPGSQIIMTSSGQILVMPPQNKSSSNQMIISGGNGSPIVMNNSTQGVVINQQGQQILSGDMIHSMDGHGQSNIIQSSGNQVVIQGSNIGQNIIQSSNNLMTGNGNRVIGGNNSNFIVNSSNNMQPMIINNSNIISHNGNVIQQGQIHGNQGNIISGTKVISNNGNILNGSNIITNQSNVLASNNSTNLISPNGTVVLPNGYVLQPQQFTTVDGQVVNVINQDSGTHQFIQSTQQRIILSPDSKRRAKKRKSSSGTPPTPHSLSPQQSPTIQQHSPTIVQQNQSGTMLQITPQYQQQSFQISPGMSGITLVQNKAQQNSGPQQQILLQNGQTIIQPLNIIGQQLLVPAGLMVTPDTTLLQIQNVGPCGSILTPQGMMIRAPSPQNKNFLSPNSGGQQFIVSGNGQISPIGQMYSTPMGLVVPQTNSNNSGPTYVQQNTTILQQQTTMINSANGNGGNGTVEQDIRSQNSQQQQMSQQHHRNVSVSPPDTTTHSPRSPERPPSQRSNGSDTNMVG